jgi:hypothetical protein
VLAAEMAANISDLQVRLLWRTSACNVVTDTGLRMQLRMSKKVAQLTKVRIGQFAACQ